MTDVIQRVVVVGCVHSGSKFADINDFKRYVDLALEPNTYLLILGDLFENAIPSRGEGMVFEQDLTPDEQIDEIARILHPVKDKIIGACTSNHSARSYKEVGIDMDRQLYKRLFSEDEARFNRVYKGLQGVVVFAGKRIAFAHGNGSGDNWNDSKKLFAIYPTADVVATSHRHEMQHKWYGNFAIDGRGHRLKRFAIFVRTGGLMDWAAYAQRELYQPQKPGFAMLFFLPDGKIRVDTNGI